MEGLPNNLAELNGDLGIGLLEAVDIVLDDIDGVIPDREVEVCVAARADRGVPRKAGAAMAAPVAAPTNPRRLRR